MSSTHPLADLGGLSFGISLRVRHPSLDPDLITTTLGLKPDHCWGCGEPRRSASGAKLGGTHRETYWSATLPSDGFGVPLPSRLYLEPAGMLARHVLQLKRHRPFFEQLRSAGGDASLMMELAPGAETTLRLDAAILRQLAELGLAVELEIMAHDAGTDS